MHFPPKTSRAVAEPGHCRRTGENDTSAVVGLEQRETDYARTTGPDPVGTRRSSESHPAWSGEVSRGYRLLDLAPFRQ